MSSTAASHGATVGDASSGRQSLSAASATSATSLQTLSVNHLQVPQPNHSTALLKPTAPMPHMLGAPPLTPSSISSGSSTNLQPAYYTATTTQRISDLRKILNPEVEEKEDPFKKITESIENCDCFEFNLNNAAKMITVLVLLATLILVIRALKGDR